MIKEITDKEKDILFHTLGFDYVFSFLDKHKIEEPTRNYEYCELKEVQSLIDKNLMQFKCSSFNRGDSAMYFEVTEDGIKLAQELCLKSLPKLTRSQKRYQVYLHCDSSETYGEWIKNSYWNDCRKRNGV